MIIVLYSIRTSFVSVPVDTYIEDKKITVLQVINTTEYTTFVGKYNNKKIQCFYSEAISLKPGDIVHISGSLNTPSKNTIPNTFNYNAYLKSKQIYKQLTVDDIVKENHTFTFGNLRYLVTQYIERYMPHSKSYIKVFILADDTHLSEITKDNISELGISHLFAVSGLHIGILVLAIMKISDRLSIPSRTTQVIIMIVLLLYLFLTNFTPSITRAASLYFLSLLNKHYKWEFSTLDLVAIIFIILLLINPFFIYSVGFKLSFLMTVIILLSHQILHKKTQLIQLYLISFICFLWSVPLVVSITHQINIVTVPLNVLFILLMTYCVLPLAYVTFLFPIFDSLYNQIIQVYNWIIHSFSLINVGIIQLSFSHPLLIILYYCLIFYLMVSLETIKKRLKTISLVFLVIFLISLSRYINPIKKVIFFDVSGDSTFISDKFNQCNILIDTGDKDDYNGVINYLLSKNIKRLDYVIISHSHRDHSGELKDILSNFKVSNLITNQSVKPYENQLIKCGSLSFYIYELLYDYGNENNNSIVLSLFINNYHMLFTGDIEIKKEQEFIQKYKIDIDILKVPHHGSYTSSTQEFISALNPKTAIIIAKRFNKFNHPSSQTINRFKKNDIQVLRTDQLGTIKWRFFGRTIIQTYYPPER
ncbi:MAG: DNA internalization-related competence protein ComEC/Rec2 [Candidatus Izimaplasma sp.]|nr:DNA internalization-related competence protein ComEC/Rec2 [Candidatus Izimaplasma bacterium]